MSGGVLTVVGDTVLDRDLVGTVERVCPDAPVPVLDRPRSTARAGGAGLAATLAASSGRPVHLVTALADDGPAEELAELLQRAGVEVTDLGMRGATPEKVRVRAAGQSLVRVDHGGDDRRPRTVPPGAVDVLAGASAVLVSDYGGGVAASEPLRQALDAVVARTPVVWDPHPRGSTPVPGVRLATPNDAEATTFTGVEGIGLEPAARRARMLLDRWRAAGVAVTLGARGALLSTGERTPFVVPAAEAGAAGDPCGAGDAFAVAAGTALAEGAVLSEAVVTAVEEATRFVSASRGADSVNAGSPRHGASSSSAAEVVDRTRASGGSVVATGGCFDLLHAGHVASLRAARRLGDALVVCLNSDASVRRLKGPGRPVVPEADRAAMLRALECVDAVEIFDDDTPVALLERLRPDVFAKGGDYAPGDLPEQAAMRRWGGQVVVLPYLSGRSSTRLIEEVATRSAEPVHTGTDSGRR